MNYVCCNDTTRRNEVKNNSPLNGIDFLEVLDIPTDPYDKRQTTLYVHFLKDKALDTLNPSNIRILGGERIEHIKVVSIEIESTTPFPTSDAPTRTLLVHVSEAGDFSTYTLQIVVSDSDQVPVGFDPILSAVDFSFKVNCPSEFDCKPVHSCPPNWVSPPEISYLAKDYASFRQLMLDRMALVMPEWSERNPADLGIVLVELLAYVADYLSYQQDVIATEAYLGTARKRISVRRHARLVDYFMHDGCNARTWLQVRVGAGANGVTLKKQDINGNIITRILTKTEGLPPVLAPNSPLFQKAITEGSKVFELLDDIDLYTEHNEMTFYLWERKDCCLPKGATTATLKGRFPNLKIGDVLILAEVLGPETAKPEDANVSRRHPVRLTKVKQTFDILLATVNTPNGLEVTEIEWDTLDALPFPLCISNQKAIDISVVWGNIVLVDHGFTMQAPTIPPSVPDAQLTYADNPNADRDFCTVKRPENIPARFRPQLAHAPLTQWEPYRGMDKEENKDKSAAALIQQSLRSVMPSIYLKETNTMGNPIGGTWQPQRDLLNSDATAKEFVAEIEADGVCYLRFGDAKQGARPESGNQFTATYRIGNGKNGNVGANTLTRLVTADAAVIAVMDKNAYVWNPLPAQGGLEAETMEEVRQFAPEAFRTQERAVTPADYAYFAQRSRNDVQQAAATFRWTGSWRTVFLTVDRMNGDKVDALFERQLRARLERYRMAGFDLEIDAPLFVSLDIALTICVNPHFFASDVKKALLEKFSNRQLSNGQVGFFHPDNFTFGQPVYLSTIYTLAQNTEGVDAVKITQNTEGVNSVKITRFNRRGDTNDAALLRGLLSFGRREIARCDNDRNFPERGVFNLNMTGGR